MHNTFSYQDNFKCITMFFWKLQLPKKTIITLYKNILRNIYFYHFKIKINKNYSVQ